jgi:aspartate/methionine/tyrosine aminotransferase
VTSRRGKDIKPFMVMEVMETAEKMERRGREVIHLEVGEPDFDTPPCVKEACSQAMQDGKTHYTGSLGLVQLREAICNEYWQRYGVEISPDQIVVTSGTSPAMLLVFSVLLEPGEAAIIPNPYYPCYPNIIRFVDANPVPVDVFEEEGFQYQPDMIRSVITPRTKAIVINSPSNPTGHVMAPGLMAELCQFGPYLVSDEIYHGLVYEGEAHTILEFTDRAFVINGFSKLYAMTGWRLGYVIAPKEFVRPMQKIQQNLFISANSMVQWSAIAALNQAEPDIQAMIETYNQRRVQTLKRLKELGFGIAIEPTGAFCILANAKRFTENSYECAFDMLEKAGVGVAPGIDFGSNAEGYLRFCYANSLENIERAMERIGNYLQGSGIRGQTD